MISVRRALFVAPILTCGILLPTVLFAQTAPPAKATTPVHRRVVPATPALPKNIPPAKGPVKVQFALRYQDITVGTGDVAQPGQIYTVNYTGWLASDGTKFDSSYDHGQPFSFAQGRRGVIVGWDEGFVGMKVGGKRRLFIPYQLAYGGTGRGQIPPKADLIFDVELVAVRDLNAPVVMPPVVRPPTPPAPPAQPAQPQTPPQPTQPQQPAQPQ
jgi:peptidylprolyl isomerase